MRRTCTSLASSVAVVALVALTGCSSSSDAAGAGPALEADCDVDGISDAAHHLVEEGGLTMGDVQDLRCDGDWSVITVGQSGDGATEPTTTLVFRRSEFGWVLKAPETACIAGPDGLPADLAALACP